MAATDFTEQQRRRRSRIFDAITRGDLTPAQRWKLAVLVEMTLILRDADENSQAVAWDCIKSDVERLDTAMADDADAEQAIA